MSVLGASTIAILQAGAVRDTIVTIQIADRSWMDVVITTSQLVVSLAVLGLLIAVVMVLLALRKGVRELTQLLHSSYGELSAAAHSVRNVADDVKGITGSLRNEAEEIGVTVRAVNDGVRSLMADAEDRLYRLGALVDVAQDEAEEFVASSVGTMRGLRIGASALRRSLFFAGRNGLFRPGRKKRRSRSRPDGRRGFHAGDDEDERPRIRPRVRHRQ